MSLVNPPAEKDVKYPTTKEYAYWIEQIRAGNEANYNFDLLISSVRPYFSHVAKSFARSIDCSLYEDFLQEGYLLIWKIIQIRDFNNFFPYASRAFYYELVKHYHKHMRSQLNLYYYILEAGEPIPWREGYTRRLLEYQERQKDYNRRKYLKQKEREKEKCRIRKRNHERYLRRGKKQLDNKKINPEKLSEDSWSLFLKNKQKYDTLHEKWVKKSQERKKERRRKYKEAYSNTTIGAQEKHSTKNSSLRKRPKCKRKMPYGFKKGKYEIWDLDKKQAPVVRLIFDLYVSGIGTQKIVEALKNRKIPAPSGKKEWVRQTVYNILRDERYSGQFIVRSSSTLAGNCNEVIIENYCPAIVSESKFLLAQEELRRKKALYNRL